MHTRKILSACGILLVPIVIWGAVLLIGGRSIPRDELVQHTLLDVYRLACAEGA